MLIKTNTHWAYDVIVMNLFGDDKMSHIINEKKLLLLLS